MSYTEIYGLTKNSAFILEEIRNAWRGAMAIWLILEKKYLPKYYPKWGIKKDEDYSRTSDLFNENAMKEIWDLFKSDKVSRTDKIVLGTTFDNVLVKVDSLQEVLTAFRNFEGETSLKEQANTIEKAIAADSKIIAIGWNQTSVNESPWTFFDNEREEDCGYNIETGTRHWFLMDEI